MNQNHFIFLDAQGKRWHRFRLLFVLGFLVAFTCMALFIQSLLVCPRLSRLQQIDNLSRALKAHHAENFYSPKPPPEWIRQGAKSVTVVPKARFNEVEKPVRLGFYAGWDPRSFISLKENAETLTHVALEWFFLTGTPAELSEKPDEQVREFLLQHDLTFMPMLTNVKGSWQPEAVETLARAGVERQQQFFADLVQKLKKLEAAGIVIDWEDVDPTYRDTISALFRTMADILHREKLEVWLCIPVGNDLKVYDLDALATVVDRFIAMLYDENGEGDRAGPIASQGWFTAWLSLLLEHGSPAQWVVGIGAYGYDWKTGEPAKQISFADCMVRAYHSGAGPIENQTPLYGPHFTYTEHDQVHEVWFLDGMTFYNQKVQAEARDAGGIALYLLGMEDPAVWQILECDNSCLPNPFETIRSTDTLTTIGEGDFITIVNEHSDGRRTITVDSSGLWNTQYVSYPSYPLLYHQGENKKEQVSITFDDGPDPEWTPRILDVLKEKGVKAAFFVVGSNAERYPDIIQRIVAEGHELGNHTYTHADISEMPPAIVKLELNAAQRIIESITDRSTLLFRPPYNADRCPHSLNEFNSLLIASELGYLTVSESIDSEDWDESSPSVILERIKDRRGEGNVVLLHDAGGDRSSTVAALPWIIDYLRNRGDEIVPLHQLIGVTRESLMPPLTSDDQKEELLISQAGFHLLHVLEQFLWAFMITSTALLLVRTFVLLVLAIRNRRHQDSSAQGQSGLTEPVSVLIAAHNEEAVIIPTLQSVLNTCYPGDLEVIVVDDGSTDNTAALVTKQALIDKRVKLIRQPKKGKAAALNVALQNATNELIVMLDADTQFVPETISALVSSLVDRGVGAVSGHVKVGNRHSWVTRFQSLEYICGFNLDRRAYDEWNCVTVVPGAVSAFRKGAILRAGGFAEDTLAEDTDLTLMMHRLGYRVCYAPHAVAFTEAPDTVSTLVRQRSRWAFGTLQCLIKHKDLLFNPKYKGLAFFSLPCIWFFHFFLVAFIPVVDGGLLLSLISGTGGAIVDYALGFMIMDLVTALMACILEGEEIRWAWLIVPMRFLYRPLLAWSVWKAFIRALRGTWVAWGHHSRRGLNLVPGINENQSVSLA